MSFFNNKIGVIASSEGSVFKETFLMLSKLRSGKYEFFVVVDRETTLIDFCKDNNIEYVYIDEENDKIFSQKVHQFFAKHHVSWVILFFLRYVTENVFRQYFTVNIHPSVLPSYKGLNVLARMIQDEYKYIGATLHIVNENIDEGKILIQTCRVRDTYKISVLNRISFTQKLMVLLIFMDYIDSGMFTLERGFIKVSRAQTTSPYFISEDFFKTYKNFEKEALKNL